MNPFQVSSPPTCNLPAQLVYVGCCADTIVNDIAVLDYTNPVVSGQNIRVRTAPFPGRRQRCTIYLFPRVRQPIV